MSKLSEGAILGEIMDQEMTLRELSQRNVHAQIAKLTSIAEYKWEMPISEILTKWRLMIEYGIVEEGYRYEDKRNVS